jgi:predicted nuclease of restriction endonuclease-like (RecB) superfamily
MVKFAREFDEEFVQTVSAQLSWSHNVTLMDKADNGIRRSWYAKASIENGWSVAVLAHQIDTKLYERQALAGPVNNFGRTLPSPESELAQQALKDPYIFDFITARQDAVEHDIEEAMTRNITKLLLELGTGFAFVGRQYHLVVDGEDFYLDLLFYNLRLRSYFVIELKTGMFKPEFIGQLNFYLSTTDALLRAEGDSPSIGLLLCKSKNDTVAEYALRGIDKPMGVSAYRLSDVLPDEYATLLPSLEDIGNRV